MSENEKTKKGIEQIETIASDAIFGSGSGGILLNGHGVFVNTNMSSIDHLTILRNLTKLSDALVKIEHIAKGLK